MSILKFNVAQCSSIPRYLSIYCLAPTRRSEKLQDNATELMTRNLVEDTHHSVERPASGSVADGKQVRYEIAERQILVYQMELRSFL